MSTSPDPQALRAALTVQPTPLRARLQTQPPRISAVMQSPRIFRAALQHPEQIQARLQKQPDKFTAVFQPTGTGTGGPGIDVELRTYVQKIMAVLDPNGPPPPNP
jgi:hypothetical protein